MLDPAAALAHWDHPGRPRNTADAGLINETWMVGDPPTAVLQWLNPIFHPTVNLEIDAVTARLADKGLVTPRLLPTRTGDVFLPDGDASWRLQHFIPGRTLHTVSSPAIAHAAGRGVGAFHAAMHGWERQRIAPRRDIHDTPTRMEELRQALEGADGHPLAPAARTLGERILAAWRSWEGDLGLPERACHGDLKISNLRFHPEQDAVVCLLDLDTVGPMDISCELGDAWRSWCNPGGEDDPGAARFDVTLFEASAEGFMETAPPLTRAERAALAAGPERICLELAGRFCRDAVLNTYFKEDRVRFPEAGAHNLHRARCQLALARSARNARAACDRILMAMG
ncbi:MAG: aminoglycoside phosphotransferase family protein [Myxococcota bacterium]|nr:aminoglycoside phosphotransferase family protein [Myxococcota bacterium]MEC8423268.1 aminoglycoside phosphotransferase family protein [Myxococcota bacterium]